MVGRRARRLRRPGRYCGGHVGTFPVGIIGILVILGLAFLLSNNKRAIRLRVVGAAFALQVTIAFIVLRSD
ncbi:Na+ dependent nucleoside transporter N-terminal domain-containing protein, partial [Pseudomonas proteolytica]